MSNFKEEPSKFITRIDGSVLSIHESLDDDHTFLVKLNGEVLDWNRVFQDSMNKNNGAC